ncbi:MAG TPA: hypothetical protein VLF39_03510 [Candidatus Saccharimonadales bacterium]|nr:hypothetical protein [Candidatus Saccharimonadales bacterium]
MTEKIELSSEPVEFGENIDLMGAVRVLGVAACLAAEVAESELLVPLITGVYALEVAQAVVKHPPKEFVGLVAKREFKNASMNGINYAFSIGKHVLKNGAVTAALVGQTNLMRKAVQQSHHLKT